MTIFHLTLKSANSKTGPIPVSTSSDDTCPGTCPFKGSGCCYAQAGPLAIHWRRLSAGKVKSALTFDAFVEAIRALPAGQIWRMNQAGDLPGKGNRINSGQLLRLARAAGNTRGWSYSHKPLTRANLRAIRLANELGLTINLSVNQPSEVDGAMARGLPTVVVLPSTFKGKVARTARGRRIVRCPATYRDGVTCATCGNGRPLCQRRDRSFAIGFPAHGSSKRKADAIVSGAQRRVR